jgi:phage host-nuclease inhibitor protein Gam
MARRKGAAVDAVQSKEEAATLLGRYAELAGEIDGINAERAVRIALIDKDADERIARREEEQKALFARLKPWWAVAGGDVAPGKRSAELGSCQIGVRLSTPKLLFGTAADEAAAISTLQGLRWSRAREFLRTKVTLDKPALLKELAGGADAAQLVKLGFAARQKEEFFIQPLAPKQSDDVVQEQPQ